MGIERRSTLFLSEGVLDEYTLIDPWGTLSAKRS